MRYIQLDVYKRQILLFAIGHFAFLFGVALPVHQPVAFDTLIVKVIALYLASVAGITLNGIDAASCNRRPGIYAQPDFPECQIFIFSPAVPVIADPH